MDNLEYLLKNPELSALLSTQQLLSLYQATNLNLASPTFMDSINELADTTGLSCQTSGLNALQPPLPTPPYLFSPDICHWLTMNNSQSQLNSASSLFSAPFTGFEAMLNSPEIFTAQCSSSAGLMIDFNNRKRVLSTIEESETTPFKQAKLEDKYENILQIQQSNSQNTKKLRGIVTRADFLEKIDKAESLEDCKNIFLSLLDVIMPGKASQNIAIPNSSPIKNDFSVQRISSKTILLEDSEYDLHKIFEKFSISKSHLPTKNIPSAFTRFVLAEILGENISKFTYCKLNNGKRGYKQLSNDFVKSIADFVAEGFDIPESDSIVRNTLRNAVENVIINTCGNARKRHVL